MTKPECEALKALATKLEPGKPSSVVASDIDKEAARVIADRLHIACQEDFGLRRFNVGRHHGAPLKTVNEILTNLVGKWQDNPDIPIRGGDSLTSFKKRIDKAIDKFIDQDVALLADEQTMRYIRERTPESLLENGNHIPLDRVYVVKRRARTA